MIHILNHHDPGSALVHDWITLAVGAYVEKFLSDKFRIEQLDRRLVVYVRSATLQKQTKSGNKLQISNALDADI